MSRLRMASGMAAAGVGAARGPAGALFRFVGRLIVALAVGIRAVARGLWTATRAVGRAGVVILPWLAAAAATAILAYLGCRLMFRIQADARTAAEATKHETAFNESVEAAVESADDLDINARIRAIVDSRGAVRGNSELGFSSLDGVPAKPADYKVFIISPDVVRAHGVRSTRDHTVKLMVIQMDWGREYISVEVNGQQAYLCIVDDGEDHQPWMYKGIGLWEHLLGEMEAFVDRDRQRQEIDSRFGNLEVGK